MISKLTGILDSISISGITVDVNGVGYELIIPLSTYDHLPKEKSKVTLFVYMSVREDAIVLYGFITDAEKGLFLLLTTVTGIGPKLALKILSSLPVNTICEYIAAANIKALSKISGLGAKSAERIVLELKEKIKMFAPESVFVTHKGPETKEAEEAMMALVQLGFKHESARKAVNKVCSELPNTEKNSENLIRLALQTLNS